ASPENTSGAGAPAAAPMVATTAPTPRRRTPAPTPRRVTARLDTAAHAVVGGHELAAADLTDEVAEHLRGGLALGEAQRHGDAAEVVAAQRPQPLEHLGAGDRSGPGDVAHPGANIWADTQPVEPALSMGTRGAYWAIVVLKAS